MPAERPLRNLTRDSLIGVYTELQSEPVSHKYNLRKELQTDKKENIVHANRWVTRDQYLEMARQEMLARGLDLPTVGDGADAEEAAPADAESANEDPAAAGVAEQTRPASPAAD